jgi:sec-independent protein translocase protein TatA
MGEFQKGREEVEQELEQMRAGKVNDDPAAAAENHSETADAVTETDSGAEHDSEPEIAETTDAKPRDN